jgi:hypothetical protein
MTALADQQGRAPAVLTPSVIERAVMADQALPNVADLVTQ